MTDNAARRPRGAHPSAGHGWPDTGYRSSRSGPLCWGQQWHWFDDIVPEERRLFTLPVADHCEIPAGASSADVHAALRIMARRHEILRTTVSRIHPRQLVHDDDELGWDVAEVAVDRLDATTLQEVEDRLIEAAIDIERTRLWRARIVTTARIPRFLVVVTHHVALDGWGLGVLLDEVHGLLTARETPPVPDSIAGHHPLDQAAAETGLDDQPAVDRWVQLLADNPVNVLAPHRGHGETGGHHATMYRSRRALADAVAIARDHATSMEMVLYTAMVHLIASRTGWYRFLAAVVVSNRPRAALRRSLGVYALPVPVQVDAEPRWSFTNLLSQASTACLRAYRHSHYSPDHLTMALARQAAERGLLGAPVLEVSFFSWARPYVAPDAVMPIATDTVWARTRPQPRDGLFVDAGNDGDYLRVDLTVGDHLLGRADAEAFPLQLCELLAAVRAGKVCRLPGQARTAVGAQWSQVREGRVRTSDVEVVLRSHPAVHDATVVAGDNGPGRGVLVAHVCVNIGSTTPTADPAPTVDPAELRRHIVDRLPDHPGVIAPHRFVVRGTGTATAAHDEIPEQCLALDEGTGRDPDPIPARGDTEQVLADAAQRVCGATIDLARSYGDHGGTLLAIPALLAGLASAGYGGLCADDLTGPASLAHLATHLSRTDPTTGPATSGAQPADRPRTRRTVMALPSETVRAHPLDTWSFTTFSDSASVGSGDRPRVVDGPVGPTIVRDGRELVNFASINFLDLQHSAPMSAHFAEGARRYGLTTGGSRMTQGVCRPHVELEAAIARQTGKERAISFATGLLANMGFVHAMTQSVDFGAGKSVSNRDTVLVLDRDSHWSLWKAAEGLEYGRQALAFRHNDVADLARVLDKVRARKVVVVIESVYSADGGVAPAHHILDECERWGAISFVDDANGFMVYGPQHRPFAQEYRAIHERADFVMVSLSKAVGLEGGAIAGPAAAIDAFELLSGTSMFTAAIQPPTAHTAERMIDWLARTPTAVDGYLDSVEHLRAELTRIGVPAMPTGTYVLSVPINDDDVALRMRDSFPEDGYLVPVFTYPAVRRKRGLLRLIANAGHTEEQIDGFLRTLRRYKKRFAW